MKIANIGSSFAAGPRIPPIYNRAAGRSGSNYAHLLADDLNAELADLSISGATLETMNNKPQSTHGTTFAPQAEGVTPDTDVVLVLGGGNDMGLSTKIISDTWIGWILLKVMQLFYSIPPADAGEQDVYHRYGLLLDIIHHRAPKAKVYVIEYLTVFGSDAVPGKNVPCTAEKLEAHRCLASQLQRATNKAVNERQGWCEIIQTAKLSIDHGIGSQEPWISGLGLAVLLRKEAWVHPNAEGHRAVYRILRQRIRDVL